MTVANSTKARPQKPYPEFPLFAHNNGQWCRKIRGKLFSFGKWDDPTAALKKHNAEYSNLKEGIAPSDSFDGWRVGDVINEYLSIQEDRVALGEIVERSFESAEYCGKLIVEFIPKQRAVDSLKPEDFRKLRNGLLKRFSPAAARVNMSRIRTIFKFAYDEQLISKPVFYGQGFKPPAKATLRKARNEKPKKLFIPGQIKMLVDYASPALKAMILLSINTGMNNSDLRNLKERHIDFETGWMDYPRFKTGIQRRGKLWPETLNALKDYRAIRITPLVQFADYFFITSAKRQWGRWSLPGEFRKLRESANSKRNKKGEIVTDKGGLPILLDPLPIPHGTFGYLRHTFETIAGGSRDQVAVDAIMGHVDSSMASEYREGIQDDRLEAVANHVRQWLLL